MTKTPLFDLRDRLLGWDVKTFWCDLGFDANRKRTEALVFDRRHPIRGLEMSHDPANRGWHCWWYEPFADYEDEVS